MVTRQKAYIWDYTSYSTNPQTRELKIPFPSRADEPVCLGTFVKPGQQSETGLVVVNPRSGKIKYWENIQNIDALNLFAKRQDGTESSMGLFSGETIVEIEDATYAGVVIATSSGRVAQVRLQDQQSRPSVNVNYLRAPRRNTSGTIFGGIMNIFGGGSLLRDIAATKLRPSKDRGSVDLFVASQSCEFQHWQLNWTDPPSLQMEYNVRELVEQAMKMQLEQQLPAPIQSVHLVDFAFMSPPGNTADGLSKTHSQELSILSVVMIMGSSYVSFAICAMNIDNDGLNVERTLLLTSYSTPVESQPSWKPRLCIPLPSCTAFVLFEKGIVSVSLASIRSKNFRAKDVFQEAIYLKDEQEIHMAGASAEYYDASHKQSSILLFIPGTGALRMTTYEPTDLSTAISRHKLSAQCKIEQVVLYSNKQANPLNLARRPEQTFSREQIEDAALEISNNILKTAYSSLATNLVSINLNLQKRAQALDALARHLKDNYPGLSRVTRWQLRYDAEKMAAAQKIWSVYMAQVSETASSKRKLFVPELIERVTKEVPQTRAIDPIRGFFVYEIDRLQLLFDQSYQAIYGLAQDPTIRGSDNFLKLVLDATNIVSAGLETAFDFRSSNAWLYDLEEEDVEDGILRSGYKDLPEPWTSNYKTVRKVADFAQNIQTAVELEILENQNEERDPLQIAIHVARENPRLIFLWWRILEEYCRWCAASSNQSVQNEGVIIQKKHSETLFNLLTSLPSLDQTFSGMQIAERIKNMPALTTLVREESHNLFKIAAACSQGPGVSETIRYEQDRLQQLHQTQSAIEELEQRIAGYCTTFGYAFTNPYYGAIVEKHAFGTLLEQSAQYRHEVTAYLRAEPARRPLAWINDVLVEKDYQAAGNRLMDLATDTEIKAWNREIELRFAKLALLAADEHYAEVGSGEKEKPRTSAWDHNATRYDSTLTFLDIQSRIWDYLRDLVYEAVDEQGMVEILNEKVARTIRVTARHALFTLLQEVFGRLVDDLALDTDSLVDVLTLTDRHDSERPDADISGLEFFLALYAIKVDTNLSKARKDTLSKIIWRRATLVDDAPNDWASIAQATNKRRLQDEQVKDLLRKTTVYRTFIEGYKFTLAREAKNESKEADADGFMTNGDVPHPPLSFMDDMPTPEPRECLEAGTKVEDWLARFGEDRRDLAEPIARDVKDEAADLNKLIEEYGVNDWFKSCKEVALEDVRLLD